ncbi:hypothetical protein ACM608_01500 [Sphingomonas sp. ID0503]
MQVVMASSDKATSWTRLAGTWAPILCFHDIACQTSPRFRVGDGPSGVNITLDHDRSDERRK